MCDAEISSEVHFEMSSAQVCIVPSSSKVTRNVTGAFTIPQTERLKLSRLFRFHLPILFLEHSGKELQFMVV